MGQGGYPELELIKIDSFRGGYELERYSYRCDRLRCTRQIISLLQPRSHFLHSLQPRPGCSRDIGADRAGGGPGAGGSWLGFAPRGSSLLELQREKYPGRRGPGLGEGTGGATVSKIAQCLWENQT